MTAPAWPPAKLFAGFTHRDAEGTLIILDIRVTLGARPRTMVEYVWRPEGEPETPQHRHVVTLEGFLQTFDLYTN